MSEQKTTLPYLRNRELKKIKVESKKVNNVLYYILMRKDHRIESVNLCRSKTNQ